MDDPNPDARLVFVYDDFLGQTNLMEKLGKNEDSSLLRFIESVRRRPNRRFILTTREYLLQQARDTYERLNRADLDIYKLVLDLAHYNRGDRARILYNHLYFSELPAPYRESILYNDAYLRIIDHPNYSPRLIEWMTRRGLQHSTPPTQYVTDFLNVLSNPITLWEAAFDSQITKDSRVLLYILYSLGAEASLLVLEQAFAAFVDCKLGEKDNPPSISVKSRVASSLKELEGSFTASQKFSYQKAQVHVIRFHNPSIRDFVEGRIVSDLTISQRLLETALYFEQCENMYRLAFSRNQAATLDPSHEPLFLDALNRTSEAQTGQYYIITYAADGEKQIIQRLRSNEELSLRILEMSQTLSCNGVLAVVLTCLERFQLRLDSGLTQGANAVALVKKIEEHLIHPMKRSVAKALAAANDITDFEAVIDFENDNPQFMKEEYIEQVNSAFEYYCNGVLDSLSDDDAQEDWAELARLEKISDQLGVDVTSALDNIRSQVEDIRRREDARTDMLEQSGYMSMRGSPSVVSSSEIHNMFDGLRDADSHNAE